MVCALEEQPCCKTETERFHILSLVSNVEVSFSDVAPDFQNHQTQNSTGHLQIAESQSLVFPKSTQTFVFFNFRVTGRSAPLAKDFVFQKLCAPNQGNEIENPFFKR